MTTRQEFCSACGGKLRSAVRFCEKSGQRSTIASSSTLLRKSKAGLSIAGLLAVVASVALVLWIKPTERIQATTDLRPAERYFGSADSQGPTWVAPTDEPSQATADKPELETKPVAEPSPSTLMATEGIDGIAPLRLDDPETYLPSINARYRHYIYYPDGDEGTREMIVGSQGSSEVLTTIELMQSKLYPNDPPALWVQHYVTRADGIYRVSDESPSESELWMPQGLALGKKWSNVVGSYEVTAFDIDLVVNGIEFTNVLAYRLKNQPMELDQTTWLAPGYGEVQVRATGSSADICKFLDFQPETSGKIEQLFQKHVVNGDKVY